MRKDNWLLYSAIGLSAAITLVIGWQTFPDSQSLPDFRYDNPKNVNYRPGGSMCEPSALAAIADTRARSRQADDCEKEAEEYRQTSDDLIQQTRAANAAQGQANIASQQLWATWWQTLGGFLTLVAAIFAAVYAREAAKTAIRELADVQRAFINPLEIEVHRVVSKSGDVLSWNFFLPWENNGSTAAQSCRSVFTTIAYSRDETQKLLNLPPNKLPDWFPFPDGDSETSKFSLGPRQIKKSGPVVLPIKSLKAVHSGEGRAYLYAWIKYTDVFGRNRETRFCAEIAGFSSDPGAAEMGSISYRSWDTFNSIDDECEKEDREAFEKMPISHRESLLEQGWVPRFNDS